MMDEQDSPTVAAVFRDAMPFWKARWHVEFPDLDPEPFFQVAWEDIRSTLLAEKDKGNFDTAWSALVNELAAPCVKQAMETTND
jgi:hypothetical protein